jgi:hypothetical protein
VDRVGEADRDNRDVYSFSRILLLLHPKQEEVEGEEREIEGGQLTRRCNC